MNIYYYRMPGDKIIMLKKATILALYAFSIISILYPEPMTPEEFEKESFKRAASWKNYKLIIEDYIKIDVGEYTEFYNSYLLAKDYILANQYKQAISVIDAYLIKYKYIFKKNRYVRDYMRYGYVSYLLFIKGLLLYETDTVKSCQLIYLNFFILDTYKFPLINHKLDSKNGQIEFPANEYFKAILTTGNVNELLQELFSSYGLYNEEDIYYSPWDNVVQRDDFRKIDKEYLDWDSYYILLSGGTYKYMKDKEPGTFAFSNLKSLKGIESALLLYIVDDDTSREIFYKLKKEANLDIKLTATYVHKVYRTDHDRFALYLTQNEKLGKRFLRKFILNLR